MTAETPTVATTDDEAVTRAVRVEMARKDWSQADLAEAANRNTTWLNNRLKGRAYWRIADVVLVARALDVPLSTLLPDPDPLED